MLVTRLGNPSYGNPERSGTCYDLAVSSNLFCTVGRYGWTVSDRIKEHATFGGGSSFGAFGVTIANGTAYMLSIGGLLDIVESDGATGLRFIGPP